MSGNTELCSAPPCERGHEAKGAGTSVPLTFRGKPIAWAMVPAIRKTILPNAFGEDEVLEEQSGAKHLIAYDGKQ